MRPAKRDSLGEEDRRPLAEILDWSAAFTARVMARIHDYDDRWPKQLHPGKVIPFDWRGARPSRRDR